MIPKILHHVWIGPLPPPSVWMDPWRDVHVARGWRYCLWREHNAGWINQSQIDRMQEWNGKADIMRYEILWRYGGIVLDADSEFVRPLDDGDFLSNEAFACYENETRFPGLMACAAMGGVPGAAFWRACIEVCMHENMSRGAEIVVGPGVLTRLLGKVGGLRVYPARAFIPMHYSGTPAPGDYPIFARQLWGNTKKLYTPSGVRAAPPIIGPRLHAPPPGQMPTTVRQRRTRGRMR